MQVDHPMINIRFNVIPKEPFDNYTAIDATAPMTDILAAITQHKYYDGENWHLVDVFGFGKLTHLLRGHTLCAVCAAAQVWSDHGEKGLIEFYQDSPLFKQII